MREISGALSCALGASVLAATTVVGLATPAEAAARCASRPVTIVGTSGNDIIRGTTGDDVILARAGDDTVSGLGGKDVLCGGRGADRLFGGEGADLFLGHAGDDHLFGGPGDDGFPSEVGSEHVSGGPGGDIAVDSRAAASGDHDEISTGVGDDIIELTAAAEGTSINAGAGDDRVKVHGESGVPISLAGGLGVDRLDLHLGESADELRLDQDADHIGWGELTGRFSGWDEMVLFGEFDLDYTGHPGDELVHLVGHGAVTASMLAGNDMFGSTSWEREPGPQHLDGGEGDDDLLGARGSDTLLGGPGADWLDGFRGDDHLDGGTGAERYLSGGDGTDTAEDPDDDAEETVCMDIELGFCADSAQEQS